MNINIPKNNSEKRLTTRVFAVVVLNICLFGLVIPQTIDADFPNSTVASYVAKTSNKEATKTIKVVVTAYSSTEDQTDDTPFITASGKLVRDGIVANNMLPFGTKIKIPGIYGEKIFTIQDRMNKRKSDYHVDIWFPTRELALNFGIKTAEIHVLEN